MLKIRNLESGYGKLRILKGISLHIKVGEIVTIIGGNGAGKSTLLKTISGLIKPFSGEIIFNDTEITNISPEKIVILGCSQVPEGRQVFSPLSVYENLVLGGYSLYKKKKKSLIEKEIKKIYKIFPKLKERKNQFAGTLSGGEQQMLAIGRALMSQPELIMMDEPSMGLAPLIVKDIFHIITKLRNQGKTILLVEQNAKQALKIADRGYVLETGTLMLEGTAKELLENQDIQRAYLGKDYKLIAQ
jgi:branched-chain amino acid transport system ATP-binding protein